MEDKNFLTYLKSNPISINKSDMTDLEYAIKDIIDTFVFRFDSMVTEFYYCVSQYIFAQEGLSLLELGEYISKIDYLYNKISDFKISWFYKSSPLLDYCNIDKIIEDAYNSSNNDYLKGRNLNISKYKIYFDTHEDMYDILITDARTDNAKLYFEIE